MIGFYDTDTGRLVKLSGGNDPIPTGCTEIQLSAEAVELAREGRSLLVIDGELVLDAAVLDADLHSKIDREAGAFRCRFITDVPGQQATYLDKERQARDLLADPEGGPFPRIAAEAQVRGIDQVEMALIIVATADQWRAIDTAIEAARIGAKLAVSAATARPAKEAAATVDWEAILQ